MPTLLETSDRKLLEQMRATPRTIAELIETMGVTATAVRQRVDRLMAVGLIRREEFRMGRGRPLSKYSLTIDGHKALGHKLGELVIALWEELHAIDDADVRKRILDGVVRRLAARWGGPATGTTAATRMEQVVAALRDQEMPVQLESSASGELPVIRFSGCPYPDLSEINHDICELETSILTSLLGQPMALTSCRCDSATGTCTYELQPLVG